MSAQLSLEQELAIIKFQEAVKSLSREEMQSRLVELYVQSIYQEVRYIRLLGNAWGIPPAQ